MIMKSCRFSYFDPVTITAKTHAAHYYHYHVMIHDTDKPIPTKTKPSHRTQNHSNRTEPAASSQQPEETFKASSESKSKRPESEPSIGPWHSIICAIDVSSCNCLGCQSYLGRLPGRWNSSIGSPCQSPLLIARPHAYHVPLNPKVVIFNETLMLASGVVLTQEATAPRITFRSSRIRVTWSGHEPPTCSSTNASRGFCLPIHHLRKAGW